MTLNEPKQIRRGEWESELAKWNAVAEQEAAAGLSSTEIAEMLGLPRDRLYQFLRAGVKTGILQVRQATRNNIAGRKSTVPVYILAREIENR